MRIEKWRDTDKGPRNRRRMEKAENKLKLLNFKWKSTEKHCCLISVLQLKLRDNDK